MLAALGTEDSKLIYDINSYYEVDAATETSIKFDYLET